MPAVAASEAASAQALKSFELDESKLEAPRRLAQFGLRGGGAVGPRALLPAARERREARARGRTD